MLTDPPIVIAHGNLSVAWAAALLREASPHTRTRSTPIMVSIDEFDEWQQPIEVLAIREALDRTIAAVNGNAPRPRVQRVDATAQTIFPHMSWSPRRPRPADELFEWYLHRMLPKLQHRSTLNRRGTYFSRMIAHKGVTSSGKIREINQLAEIIRWYREHEQPPINSITQVTIREPIKDHTGAARQGFPCLQQLSFARHKGELVLGAYYPTESIFERGYGNYLGLCRLGCFMAVELGLRLARVNVLVLQPRRDEKLEGPLDTLVNTLNTIPVLATSVGCT